MSRRVAAPASGQQEAAEPRIRKKTTFLLSSNRENLSGQEERPHWLRMGVLVLLLLTGQLQDVLLDGQNLFCHFIHLFAASTVVGWGLVLGGSIPPLFARLTDVQADRPAFQQTGPFHIAGMFKGL